MTHKPPQRPGRLSMPWVTSAGGTSDARVGQAPVRARLVSLLLRPTAPPLALGVVVAAFLIAAETLLVYLLTQVAPGMAFGVVYLLGVLVVSTGWGCGLAVTMSVASALAFDYFHVQPGGIVPDSAADVVVITMFVVVALAANTLAGLARARAAEADQRRGEADQRRREADLAAERAHALAGLQAALRRVAVRERTALKRVLSRANGTKFGRPRKVDDAEHIATAKRMKADGHTGRDIAKYLGVSRATLYRYLDENGAA